jgi:hypothetical protein
MDEAPRQRNSRCKSSLGCLYFTKLLLGASMGYLDALTFYHFRTARDGRKIYLPMSFRGRGYIVGSEQDFQRLQSQIKTGTLVSLFLIIGVGLVSNLASYVVAALVIVFYTIWSRYRVRGMQPSEQRLERQSLKEGLAFQARAHSTRSLWFLEISSLVLVCGAIGMLFDHQDKRLVAWTGLALFGSGAVLFAYQLILRQREAPAPRTTVD